VALPTGYLRIADADGIRTITLDRPQARNAMTPPMRVELAELLQIADNHETAISCPVRLTHLVALVSGKYHSKTQENNQ